MSCDADDRSTRGDDRRRAQLLEAAGRVFARAPAGGLTLAAVAQEAGVSRRLMYHYFADLRSLYAEMFDARILEHVRSVDAALAEVASAPPEERLATGVRRFLDLPTKYRRWTLMAITDTLPAELAPQRELVFEVLVQRWGQFPAFARLDPATKRTVMSMIVTNVCLLAMAMDAGDLTADQATEIGIGTIIGIARASHDATAAGG